MHIAICDDEQKELLHLKTLVNKYDSGIDVSLFSSAESMLNGIKKRCSDIILLDIEMEGMNGFAAAKELADMKNPPLVIFVTNSGEYTYRGYEVDAFRYLPKPVSYEVLAQDLSAAIAKVSSQKFAFKVDGCSHVIPINDILYFETSGHNLITHTKMTEFECRMNLSDAEISLPGNAFASPYKGYLVNLDHVGTVDKKDITLTNGVKVPLSRGRKKEFEQALFRFVRRLR